MVAQLTHLLRDCNHQLLANQHRSEILSPKLLGYTFIPVLEILLHVKRLSSPKEGALLTQCLGRNLSRFLFLTALLWLKETLCNSSSNYYKKSSNNLVNSIDGCCNVELQSFRIEPSRNCTSAWVLFCKFAAYFQNTFFKNTSGGFLL